jgi:hypothetical protein
MLLINPYRFAAPRSSDADVNSYILAVEAADGQQLEQGVISAVESFVVGCKSDGIWSAIKASCILAGARTLSGALVPLVGTAPTNANFVSGDYNRETGLIANGSTKRLVSENNNTLAQNNNHIYIRITDEDTRTVSAGIMGTSNGVSGATYLRRSGSTAFQAASMNISFIARTATNVKWSQGCGIARGSSSQVQWLENSVSRTTSLASQTPRNEAIYVFNIGTGGYTTSRGCFFSIGESLNLALLDTRVSTLMTDLAAAI